MSDTERIYSLYVQANPVPEPNLLAFTQDEVEAELFILERSRVMDTREPDAIQTTLRPSRSRIAAFAFAAVVFVGAVVGVGFFLTGDRDLFGAGGTPTLSFDGTTATYRGPATFDDNLITFRLENTGSNIALFGWNVMNDESITLEEEIAWMETHRGVTYEIPPWVEEYGRIGMSVWPDEPVERSVEIPNGKGLLYMWDIENRILYPAAHITVSGG